MSPLATAAGLATDGAGGAWMGPDGEWTGSAWLDQTPDPASFAGTAPYLADLARIPGSATIWAVGELSQGGGALGQPLIAAFGPLP